MLSGWAKGLQARLYILALLAVVPAVAVLVHYALQDRRAGASHASEHLADLARTVSFEYRSLIEDEHKYLSLLSQLPEVRNGGETCNRYLVQQREKSERLLNIGVIDARGNLRCSAVPFHRPVFLGDRIYFQDAFKRQIFGVGDFQVGRVTAKPSINFAVPIFDANGAPTGVVYSAVSLSWLSQALARTPLPDGASTVIFDREGTVLLQRPASDETVGAKLSDPALLHAAQSRVQGDVIQSIGPTGTLHLYAFVPLTGSAAEPPSAYVLVGMPLALAYADADYRLMINLVLLTVVGILMLLIARWMGARLIMRPVNALADTAERLGQGDLSARTHMVYEESELGRLARTFDDMAQRLEKQAAEQKRDQERIRHLNRVYALLSRVDHAIVHQRERGALLEEVCRVVVKDGGFRFAWVGWADHALGIVRPVAHHGYDESFLDGHEISLNHPATDVESPAAIAIREDRATACNDIETDPRVRPWREAAAARGYRAWGAFPLRAQGAVVAVLNVFARETGFFNDDEMRLLGELSSDISFGLDTIEQDVQRREADQRLKFLAYHDPVTELPNLLRYDELQKDMLARSRRDDRPFALMLVALHRLDEVTATFGHHLESELLHLTAQRLRQSMRTEDVVARGAGEHFNLMLPGADAEVATRTARHLIKIMEQPFVIEGLDIELGVAIGIALFPGHGEDIQTLDRCAHGALTEAKRAGGGYAFYAPGHEIFSASRLALVSELRQAIEGNQLLLVYQPKVDLMSGELAGVEALVRWRHPTRGIIMPDQFIPVAEQTGMIRTLTYAVIDLAAKQAYAFRRAEMPIPVAVNLSTLNLLDPRLPGRLQNDCVTWGVEPGAIELEITESAIMQDPQGAYQVLRRLNEAGYLLYIDDFGTGYSSLGYLKKLPVDALKIDKSFVIEMLKDKDAEQIVRSTIDLAHDLGLKVVAEGVEKQEALDRLALLGCDMAQGYYIGRPMEIERLNEWLSTSSWRLRRSQSAPSPSDKS